MRATKVFTPKAPSGRLSTFVTNRSFQLPPGKTLAYTPVMNFTDQAHLNAGITHVNYNTGIDLTNVGVAGRKGMFIENPAFLKDYVAGAKPASAMTEGECRAAVNYWLNQGGHRSLSLLTHATNEGYGSLEPWVTEPGSQQMGWINQEFAAQLPAGGVFAGSYDGHVYLIGPTDDFVPSSVDNLLRSKMNNPQAAYEFLKTATGFGNRFFTHDECMWRDGIINTYWAGYKDAHKRLCMFLIAFHLDRLARQYKGTNYSTMSFCLIGKCEFDGFQQKYRHTVADGVFEANTFPQYGDPIHTVLGYINAQEAKHVYCWEDTSRYGTNPNVISDDYTTELGDVLRRYVGPGNPQRMAVPNLHNPGGAPYPHVDMGSHDAYLEGVKAYCTGYALTGSTEAFWARHRKTSGGNYCSTGPAYLIDRYVQREPLCYVRRSGNLREVFLIDFANPPGTYHEWEVDVDGGSAVFVCEGGGYFQGLLDLNSGNQLA